MTLFKTDHLTQAFDAGMNAAIQNSHPGMAHFAGSGPAGKVCRECKFFASLGHHEKRGVHGGRLKDATCRKYSALMNGEGPRVPPSASACKFFEENPNPPAMFDRG